MPPIIHDVWLNYSNVADTCLAIFLASLTLHGFVVQPIST